MVLDAFFSPCPLCVASMRVGCQALPRERWESVLRVESCLQTDDKTELTAIGTSSKLSEVILNLTPMSISGYDIPFSQSVRYIVFYLDETLCAHIKYLCRILFCQLRRIGKIRSFLSTDAANKLAVSLILSRFDYCNSLLAGIPGNKLNKLQRICSPTCPP